MLLLAAAHASTGLSLSEHRCACMSLCWQLRGSSCLSLALWCLVFPTASRPLLLHMLWCTPPRPAQSYNEQHQQATSRLSDLDRQFESAVAQILGITPEQQPRRLAEALQEQQQLQEVQVRCCWRRQHRLALSCLEQGLHSCHPVHTHPTAAVSTGVMTALSPHCALLCVSTVAGAAAGGGAAAGWQRLCSHSQPPPQVKAGAP